LEGKARKGKRKVREWDRAEREEERKGEEGRRDLPDQCQTAPYALEA